MENGEAGAHVQWRVVTVPARGLGSAEGQSVKEQLEKRNSAIVILVQVGLCEFKHLEVV